MVELEISDPSRHLRLFTAFIQLAVRYEREFDGVGVDGSGVHQDPAYLEMAKVLIETRVQSLLVCAKAEGPVPIADAYDVTDDLFERISAVLGLLRASGGDVRRLALREAARTLFWYGRSRRFSIIRKLAAHRLSEARPFWVMAVDHKCMAVAKTIGRWSRVLEMRMVWVKRLMKMLDFVWIVCGP